METSILANIQATGNRLMNLDILWKSQAVHSKCKYPIVLKLFK